jgi:uncharacterized protein YjbJ (UPF0337 family)
MPQGCCSTGPQIDIRHTGPQLETFGPVAIGNVGTDNHPRDEGEAMGLDDKIENKGEDLKGKAKEATGKATDDEELESEGKGDQTKSSLKDAKENVKDAFS